MYAVRAPTCFDGSRFLPGGATVLVAGGRVAGVEPFGCDLPEDCELAAYDGTLLSGLVDSHVHLVTDSGPDALGRVAGYSAAEIDDVVTEALRRHLAAGVTTVRDLGDRDFTVVERRDRQAAGRSPGRPPEPHIVASGPPVTVPGGHCHFLGGVAEGVDQLRAAVRDRVDRGVDVVKVMASGGMNTPGSDVTAPQYATDELRVLVDEAHAAGLPVAAHAHAAAAVEQAVELRVESIEHASYLTRSGALADAPGVVALMASRADDEQLERLASSGIAVCPTLGGFSVAALAKAPPPMLARMRELGVTPESLHEARLGLVARMAAAGVRLVSGTDAGIMPGKAHGAYAEAVLELAAVEPTAAALAAATSGAAEVCGRRTGRLQTGWDADLLVVGGDLTQDLTALRRPVAVVLAGQPLT